MAKNKKAQILAAVMCATTVVGFSPAVSSANDVPNTDASYEQTTDGKLKLTSDNGFIFTTDVTGDKPASNSTFTIDDRKLDFDNGKFQVWYDGSVVASEGKIKLQNDGAIVGASGKFKVASNGNVTGQDMTAKSITINGITIASPDGAYLTVGDTTNLKLYKDGGIAIGNLNFNQNGTVRATDVYGNMQSYDVNESLKNTSGITRTGYNGYIVTDIEGAKFYDNGGFATKDRTFVVNANGDVTTEGNVTTAEGADLNAMNNTLTAYEEAGIVAGTSTGDYDVVMGDGSYNTGEYGVVIGKDANNTGFGSMAIGAHASVTGNDSIALGFGSQATEDHVVSVGSYTQQRRIINVADGENDSDAATVGQLNKVQAGVDETFDEYKEAGIVAGTSTGDYDIVMGEGSQNTGEYGVVIGEQANNTGFGSMAIGAHTMVSGNNSIALGFGSQATEDNVVSVGGYGQGQQRRIVNVADGVNDTDAATVGQLKDVSQKVDETSENVAGIDRIENEDGSHTTVINEDTSIKGDLNVDGTLTVGGEQIATGSDVSAVSDKVNAVDTKVGDTADLNSAITERQEYKDNQSLVGAINAESAMRQELTSRVDGLDSRVSSLEDRMGDVEDRIDKVGAMAAAIANLRTMGYDPEAPTEIAVGVGQYKSETGLALGVFHYPNEDFMLSASISTSGDEVMGGIGATWKIGRKSAQERAIDDEKSRELKAEEKAAEMQEAAQKAKVDAQRERHAQMLAEREAANK